MSILFYSPRNEYGCFSNFSNHPITHNGIIYKTTEHYFQAQKFLDDENRQDVIDAETPREAASIGRDRGRPLRKDWENVKNKIMEDALMLKVNQYPEILKILLSTGDSDIIEDSPIDYYWGIGKERSGLNMLGKCWMNIRIKLKEI